MAAAAAVQAAARTVALQRQCDGSEIGGISSATWLLQTQPLWSRTLRPLPRRLPSPQTPRCLRRRCRCCCRCRLRSSPSPPSCARAWPRTPRATAAARNRRARAPRRPGGRCRSGSSAAATTNPRGMLRLKANAMVDFEHSQQRTIIYLHSPAGSLGDPARPWTCGAEQRVKTTAGRSTGRSLGSQRVLRDGQAAQAVAGVIVVGIPAQAKQDDRLGGEGVGQSTHLPGLSRMPPVLCCSIQAIDERNSRNQTLPAGTVPFGNTRAGTSEAPFGRTTTCGSCSTEQTGLNDVRVIGRGILELGCGDSGSLPAQPHS